MELVIYSECCDKCVDDKDFVNMYGGVVYDYDSMLKFFVVYFLVYERMNLGVNYVEKL